MSVEAINAGSQASPARRWNARKYSASVFGVSSRVNLASDFAEMANPRTNELHPSHLQSFSGRLRLSLPGRLCAMAALTLMVLCSRSAWAADPYAAALDKRFAGA